MKLRTISLIIALAAIISAFSSCSEKAETEKPVTSYEQSITAATSKPVETTVQPTTSEAEKYDKKAESILAEMTLEEKVGQVFFARFPSDGAAEDAGKYHFGGYILFGRDFEGKTSGEVTEMISGVQSNARLPLLIGVDEEGGTVVRVSDNPQLRDEPFDSPKNIYESGGWEAISNTAAEKAQLLKSLGINVNLDPVCDLVSDSASFMYDRSFSGDAEMTGEFVRRTVKEYSRNKLGSVLKHFPGYGENSDTHTGIAVDGRELYELEQNDFIPFAEGIKAGADCVLVSHNIIIKVDEEYPASLSETIHNILREKLNFDGVIMTDDLIMEAITDYTGDENAAVTAVKCGNDLLISSNYEEQYPAVLNAAESGEISLSQLEASVKRILVMKLRLGIIS